MIGRASIGNPWVFWSDKKRDKLTLKDKTDMMIHHFQLVRQYKAERISLIEFRKHVSGYIHGFPGAKTMRLMLMQSQTEKEFIEKALSIV